MAFHSKAKILPRLLRSPSTDSFTIALIVGSVVFSLTVQAMGKGNSFAGEVQGDVSQQTSFKAENPNYEESTNVIPKGRFRVGFTSSFERSRHIPKYTSQSEIVSTGIWTMSYGVQVLYSISKIIQVDIKGVSSRSGYAERALQVWSGKIVEFETHYSFLKFPLMVKANLITRNIRPFVAFGPTIEMSTAIKTRIGGKAAAWDVSPQRSRSHLGAALESGIEIHKRKIVFEVGVTAYSGIYDNSIGWGHKHDPKFDSRNEMFGGLIGLNVRL